MDVGIDLETVGHGDTIYLFASICLRLSVCVYLFASICSVRLETGFPDHAGPDVDIGSEPRVEFRRRSRDRLSTQLDHALLKVGIVDDGADVAVQEGDDVARRTGR